MPAPPCVGAWSYTTHDATVASPMVWLTSKHSMRCIASVIRERLLQRLQPCFLGRVQAELPAALRALRFSPPSRARLGARLPIDHELDFVSGMIFKKLLDVSRGIFSLATMTGGAPWFK